MNQRYIRKSVILKQKPKYLLPLKEWSLPHARITLYKKRFPFKLKHTNVIVIIPTSIEKRATKRNRLKRYLKQQFAPLLTDDLVLIIRFY